MTTLTIEIPDNVEADVVKYLKDNQVTIIESKPVTDKTIDDLTEADYRKFFTERAKITRNAASKYL